MRPKKTEGAGKAGCALHPRSRVQKMHKKTHTSIQVQTEHSGFPRAMGLRLISCSPRRRIRLVTVADRLTVHRNPVGFRKTSAGLTPATGARTTRFCRTQRPASPGFRRSSARRSIAHKPEARPAISNAPDAAASTASHPNVRDDGQRPSKRDETAGVMPLICGEREGEYFSQAVWTGQIRLIRLKKSVFARNAPWAEKCCCLISKNCDGPRCCSPGNRRERRLLVKERKIARDPSN